MSILKEVDSVYNQLATMTKNINNLRMENNLVKDQAVYYGDLHNKAMMEYLKAMKRLEGVEIDEKEFDDPVEEEFYFEEKGWRAQDKTDFLGHCINNKKEANNVVNDFKANHLERLEKNKIQEILTTSDTYFPEKIKPQMDLIKGLQNKKYMYIWDLNSVKEICDIILDLIVNFESHHEIHITEKEEEEKIIKREEDEVKFLENYLSIKEEQLRMVQEKEKTREETEQMKVSDIMNSIKERSLTEKSNKEKNKINNNKQDIKISDNSISEIFKEPKKKEEVKKEEVKKEEVKKEEVIKGGKKEKDTKKKIEEDYFTEESLLNTIDQNKINDLEQELNNYDTKDKKYKNLKCKIYSFKNKKKISKRRKLNNKNGISKKERLENLDN
jgi:hypothetical protein